jgi:hypothetical protein
MKLPSAFAVVVVAGLLLGLPAVVAAQRPTEGSGHATSGSVAGGGGAPSGTGPASSASGGGGGMASGGGGSVSSGNSGSPSSNGGGSSYPSSIGSGSWGATGAIRRRDEVIQRPGFTDATNERGAARSYSAGASEVPWYSRPRGNDVPATGTAMPRSEWTASHPPGTGGGGNPGWDGGGYYPGNGGYYFPYWAYMKYGYGWNSWYTYPSMWNYGYPDCGYGGYGMGYFFYNPFGWNYYGNCGYYGSGAYGPLYGAEYGGQGQGVGSGGAVGGSSYYATRGGLRLKVKPANARVFVDGYYAGNVDSFDGAFQKLAIERGKHKIELSAAGYAPIVFEIEIKDFETVTWEGNLEKIK